MTVSYDVLHGILEISYLVGSVMELDAILDRVCGITAKLMNAPACSIYLLDDDGTDLVLRASRGPNSHMVGQIRQPITEGIMGWCVTHNEVVAVRDYRKDSRFKTVPGQVVDDTNIALLSCPLRMQDKVVGVMVTLRADPPEWTQIDITLFETVCKQVAIVMEKSQLYFQSVEQERLAAIGLSLSEISHYIKNLLQGMDGGRYFVETGLKRGDLARASEGWAILERNTKRISSLVQNMLNYSRSSSLHFEQENLNGLLYDIARTVEESAEQRGIAMRINLDDTIPELPLSYDALHEAFYNLISNALDAFEEGKPGTITINSRLDLSRECARVEIVDTGIGISAENLPRIFQLFYSTKGRRGTGIGLAVTKKIIEEHGGRIFVQSEVGKGTRFTVELPLEAPKRPHAQ